MVTRRLNTFTSRTRGGTKHTAVNDKAKTTSTTKKHTKPNYVQIAKDVHKNLQQAKLSPLKKVEQKVLNYKLKQLLKLPKKEFVAHMKTKFTKEDVRLLLELIFIEYGYPTRVFKKKWNSMIDGNDDKIYNELYDMLKNISENDYLNAGLSLIMNILIIGMSMKSTIFKEDSAKIALASILVFFSNKLKRKTENFGVFTDSSIKSKIKQITSKKINKKQPSGDKNTEKTNK